MKTSVYYCGMKIMAESQQPVGWKLKPRIEYI